LKARAPFEVLDLKDVEKVRLHELRNISFYLAGNDLIINNLVEVTIKQEGDVVIFSGKQDL
jgi:predicted aspartyl protease